MLKSKVKIVTATLIIFVISLLWIQNNYAMNQWKKKDVESWKVVMTSDTKDLKDTQEIKFQVENNPYVVSGKIAPGMKATATIEIDLTKIEGSVEFLAISNFKLWDSPFQLTAEMNGKKYELGTTILLEENRKQNLILRLECINENDLLDTMIGSQIEEISLPFTITITQVI